MQATAVGYVPGADPNRYYAYRSEKRSAYYFFNPITNKTVWEQPQDAPIFFGDTLQPFVAFNDGYQKMINPLMDVIMRNRAQSTRRRRETFVLRKSCQKDAIPANFTMSFSKTADLNRQVGRVRTSSGVFNSVLGMSGTTTEESL